MSLSKKPAKRESKSFLESPAIDVLNKAIEEVEKQVAELPFLLHGQETNLFLNQAAEIALIEMRLASQFADQLIALYRTKHELLDAKVKTIDHMENMSSVVTTCDQAKEFADKMKDLSKKIKRGELEFLRGDTFRRPDNYSRQANIKKESKEETISMNSLSVPLQEITQNATASSFSQEPANNMLNIAFADNSLPPQKPTFSSDFCKKMVAEAEESARKTRRIYTPSRVESISRVQLFIPTTINENEREKENVLVQQALQSGGSSLDGSFMRPGGTYDDSYRPPSTTPGRAPLSINFDETGLEEFNHPREIIPVISEAPPMNLPLNNSKADLGPIIQTSLKYMNEVPTRPTFSSSFGQKLNKM